MLSFCGCSTFQSLSKLNINELRSLGELAVKYLCEIIFVENSKHASGQSSLQLLRSISIPAVLSEMHLQMMQVAIKDKKVVLFGRWALFCLL